MTYAAKRWNRMAAWCEAHPASVYVHYDDSLSDDQVNMLLCGEFEAFDESIWETVQNAESYSEHWQYERDAFCREFGFDSWEAMPERIQDIFREHTYTDDSELVHDLCKNTRAHVNAVLHKRGGELIYTDKPRYIKDAFGFEGTPTQIIQKLECVYGGYDMESAVIIGTISGDDLFKIYQKQKAPRRIQVGPRDSDNLLFYEFCNGAGNLGGCRINRTRSFDATFHVDGTRGYGIDSCYGFVGRVWRHELAVLA